MIICAIVTCRPRRDRLGLAPGRRAQVAGAIQPGEQGRPQAGLHGDLELLVQMRRRVLGAAGPQIQECPGQKPCRLQGKLASTSRTSKRPSHKRLAR
jgi:hypothetical protein